VLVTYRSIKTNTQSGRKTKNRRERNRKIHCDKRAIGYVWFHDLVDFVRAKILFRIF